MYPNKEPDAMSLSDKLREQTRAAHRGVEQATLLKAVFQEGFGGVDYANLLARWCSLFQVFDVVLDEFSFQEYTYAPRRPFLVDDITALSDVMTRGVVPKYTGWRPVCFEEKLGCVYVIEGSSLGAKLICKRLRNVLGDQVEAAISFYSYQAVLWPTFRHWLDLEGSKSDVATRQVVEGANSTFGAIRELMNVWDIGQLEIGLTESLNEFRA